MTSSTDRMTAAAHTGLHRRAVSRGWLRDGERLLVPRLAFPLAQDQADIVHALNRPRRDQVIADMLDGPPAGYETADDGMTVKL